MQIRLIACLLILFPILGKSQEVISTHEHKPSETKNIVVEKISNSEDATVYLIWVLDTVKPHYHAEHTETIYLQEGEIKFYVNEDVHRMKAGDFFLIPRRAVHSVKVTSEGGAKVISTQCPEFLGKDRIFVEEEQKR
ncbi:cupin domain-containing protein [Salibacteraceae bacterium]|jgi:quercetin dioxygenase-like cupin family protein|nr:cupin domain-containing protein [Salibacteraceae bacterium]